MNNKDLIINKLNNDNNMYGSNLVLVDYEEEIENIPQNILINYLDEIYADSNKFTIKCNGKEYEIVVLAYDDEIELRVNL